MDTDASTETLDGTEPASTDSLEQHAADGERAQAVGQPHAETPSRDPLLMSGDLPDARAYIRKHPRGCAVLVLITLAVIMMLALAWRLRSNLPDLEFIDQDARARIASPAYDGGDFGDDEGLALTQVTVGARQHSDHAPEGSELDETFGAMSYATSDVILTYQNESVIATQTATLGYAKQNASWIDAGSVNNEQVSFTATAGVSRRKVLRNIDQLLERADSAALSDEGLPSLAALYEDATFEVTSSSFDDAAQTDTLTIHARKGSLFSAYECDMVATFSFGQGNGTWELTSCTVTDDAWVRRFDPIVGVWQGTFKSQSVSTGSTCLSAADTPLVLTITSWKETGEGTRVTGTVSVVAHYHQSPTKEQKTATGDEVLVDVPFTATLTDPGKAQEGAEAVCTAVLSEAAGKKVTITLQFGVGEKGEGAVAVVTTEYHYETTSTTNTSTGTSAKTTTQNQVRYTDTYELELMPEGWEPEKADAQSTAPAAGQEGQSDDAPKSSGG